MEMDERLKRKILMFHIGGIVNALLGLYVLFEGSAFLAPDTARTLAIIFFVFTAVDFYLPYLLKQKWRQANRARQGAANDPVERT